LLPALSAALLVMAVAAQPAALAAWPASLANAWRAAGDRAAGALLLSLALAVALWPPAAAACAPGAPLPGAPGRALRGALGQALLGAAATLAGLLVGPPGAAWRWAPLLAWLSLLPLPPLFGLSWTPLLAGPLVWLAAACK